MSRQLHTHSAAAPPCVVCGHTVIRSPGGRFHDDLYVLPSMLPNCESSVPWPSGHRSVGRPGTARRSLCRPDSPGPESAAVRGGPRGTSESQSNAVRRWLAVARTTRGYYNTRSSCTRSIHFLNPCCNICTPVLYNPVRAGGAGHRWQRCETTPGLRGAVRVRTLKFTFRTV